MIMTERLLIVVAAMAASIVCVFIVRKRITPDALRENNEFAGLAYAIIGAVYGVYLAFTVVVVWEQFGEAERYATSEAVYLSQVWRDVQVLPLDARDAAQSRLLAYAEAVVDREWLTMADAAQADPETSQIYEDLWRSMYAARGSVASAGDAAFFDAAVDQLNQLGMSRRLRLLSANARLPSIMWILLVGGGVLTLMFTFAIGARHAWVQAAMTAAVTGLIVFSLMIVAALQHPFAGDVSVTPDAMEGVRQSLNERLQRQGMEQTTDSSPERAAP